MTIYIYSYSFTINLFVFHRETSDQFLITYAEVVYVVDQGFVMNVSLLDFSSAFDGVSVSHNIILKKLRIFGVGG